METPKVSIVVPIYNVEKYLRQCLDSIIHQTLKDIEIICVDDGSTDASPEIIREYMAKDPRVKVITKPNSGYGNSMNRGFDMAEGNISALWSQMTMQILRCLKLYTVLRKRINWMLLNPGFITISLYQRKRMKKLRSCPKQEQV